MNPPTRTESETKEYYIRTLANNCIYIPFRYVLPMIELDCMKTFVQVIEMVNREDEKAIQKWKDEADLLRLYEKYERTNDEKRKSSDDDDDDERCEKRMKTGHTATVDE